MEEGQSLTPEQLAELALSHLAFMCDQLDIANRRFAAQCPCDIAKCLNALHSWAELCVKNLREKGIKFEGSD